MRGKSWYWLLYREHSFVAFSGAKDLCLQFNVTNRDEYVGLLLKQNLPPLDLLELGIYPEIENVPEELFVKRRRERK